MKKIIRLIIPGILCCVTLTTPALAFPSGTIDSHTFSVTPVTYWYPGANPMLNIALDATVNNSDPLDGYASIYLSTQMTYNQGYSVGSTYSRHFMIPDRTIQHLSVIFGDACAANPDNTPRSNAKLESGNDYGSPGFGVLAANSRLYTGSP